MDHCTSHDTQTIIHKFNSNNIDIAFIPKRMTSLLQPLDRAINFLFKKYLKMKFTEFILNENKKKESLEDARTRIITDNVNI